jgi:hypothetical protein
MRPSNARRMEKDSTDVNLLPIFAELRKVRVPSPGRPHCRLLVAVNWNTEPDSFDGQAFDDCQLERRFHGQTPRFRDLRKRYRRAALHQLVTMWGFLRKILPRYGLSRAELLPLRKGKEANSVLPSESLTSLVFALSLVRSGPVASGAPSPFHRTTSGKVDWKFSTPSASTRQSRVFHVHLVNNCPS